NPLRQQGSQECLRQYHIRSPRHNTRPLLTSPATKTQPPCAGSRPACRRPIPSPPSRNGRYVNVRMERMRQGLELAQRGAVTLPEDGEDLSAVVRSGSNLYQIDTRLLTCTCADYQKHLQACKHLLVRRESGK